MAIPLTAWSQQSGTIKSLKAKITHQQKQIDSLKTEMSDLIASHGALLMSYSYSMRANVEAHLQLQDVAWRLDSLIRNRNPPTMLLVFPDSLKRWLPVGDSSIHIRVTTGVGTL